MSKEIFIYLLWCGTCKISFAANDTVMSVRHPCPICRENPMAEHQTVGINKIRFEGTIEDLLKLMESRPKPIHKLSIKELKKEKKIDEGKKGFMDDLLTRKELAELLSLSDATLSVWASTGKVKIPYIKIGGAVRYKLEDVITFLDKNKHEG